MTAKWIGHCPNNHKSNGGNGMCARVNCAHCDPIVKKATRTKDGKASDGLAAIDGGRGSRVPRTEQRRWRR